jgi:hypothetical protein
MRRLTLGGVAVLLAVPAAATAAPVAQLSASETNQKSARATFVVFMGADAADDVSFSASPLTGGVTVNDPGVPIAGVAGTGGPGVPMLCTSGFGSAACVSSNPVTATHEIGSIYVDGGAGDDTLVIPSLPYPGHTSLVGGPGDDVLSGDFVQGGPGADAMHGGTVDYASATGPVSVTDDGLANDGQAGEGDMVDFRPANLWIGVTGSAYGDRIDVHGTAGALGLGGDDVISVVDGQGEGDDGNDRITVLGSSQFVKGDDGDDTIDVRNGVRNSFVQCGGGDDTVVADSIDNVFTDCEHVTVG